MWLDLTWLLKNSNDLTWLVTQVLLPWLDLWLEQGWLIQHWSIDCSRSWHTSAYSCHSMMSSYTCMFASITMFIHVYLMQGVDSEFSNGGRGCKRLYGHSAHHITSSKSHMAGSFLSTTLSEPYFEGFWYKTVRQNLGVLGHTPVAPPPDHPLLMLHVGKMFYQCLCLINAMSLHLLSLEAQTLPSSAWRAEGNPWRNPQPLWVVWLGLHWNSCMQNQENIKQFTCIYWIIYIEENVRFIIQF